MLTPIPGAPFLDLAAMVANERTGKISPQAIARAQGQGGRSWGYLDAKGVCVACAGLLPLAAPPPDDPRPAARVRCFEAWFLARPAAAAHMLSFVRWAQLTLQRVAQDGPIEARAYVAEGHTPGQRIVRAIGFRRDAMAGADTWIYRA
jgi:hypothetical protein